MSTQFKISTASGIHRNAIIALLQTEKLPTEDLPLAVDNFLVAIGINNELIGAIGLESHGNYGLLRSMVVSNNFRSLGIASKLVSALEKQAEQIGFHSIYLLTETADGYFKRKGHTNINRDNVPAEIKASTEFANVCPVSAQVMIKQISL